MLNACSDTESHTHTPAYTHCFNKHKLAFIHTVYYTWCTHNVLTQVFFYLFIFIMTGRMPTNVLGKVYSPDPDDWDNKTYAFEGHVPKWDLLLFFLYTSFFLHPFPLCPHHCIIPSTWLACLYTSPSTLPIFPALFVLFKGVNVKPFLLTSQHLSSSLALLYWCCALYWRGVYNDKMIQTGPALRCLEHIGAWAITLSESSVHPT